jgi:Ankyrin repeats (3 copies)
MEEPTLYIHLNFDGGIFTVDGDTGESAWVTERKMKEMLGTLKERGGNVLYSRERPTEDPPRLVAHTFRVIISYELPIKVIEEPHPDALPNDDMGLSLLMIAAYQGWEEHLEDLIGREAELEQKDDNGYTALMYAANAGQSNAVEILIKHGANVNAADNDNSTPIMFAAQHGYTNIVELLIDAGAKVNAKGNHGLTALGFAQQNGHRKTEKALQKAGAGQASGH